MCPVLQFSTLELSELNESRFVFLSLLLEVNSFLCKASTDSEDDGISNCYTIIIHGGSIVSVNLSGP